MAVEITRHELTAKELRHLAARGGEVGQSRRLLAIRLVREGKSRGEATAAYGMDRQTLRDWVHRYNAEGPDGLKDRKRVGRKPRLDAQQMKALEEIVAAGPGIAVDGVVGWRCADFCAVIRAHFDVGLRERQAERRLKKMGFGKLTARPLHPHAGPATQEAFKKTSPIC